MKTFYIFLFVTFFSNFYAQKSKLIFYNVENLFDTIDDPNKNDNEFLPGSKHQWNASKYLEKLNHINRVLDDIGSVALAGFCEIENREVIFDLNKNSKSRQGFKIIHEESMDQRGIDVALIYNPSILKEKQVGKIRFVLTDKDKPSTRDILWAKFESKKDSFILLVNHWPSRTGGEEKTNVYRLDAAKNARIFIDSVQKISPKIGIVLMGDLNDYPTNEAPKLIAEKLNPMILNTSGEFGGTYFYNKQWDILDHVFISNNLLENKRLKIKPQTGKIHSFPYLVEEYKGDKKPFRTYASSKYLGGYSDHLPVSIQLKF